MKKYEGYALITGGSSGIGFEFAKKLAAQGYDLVLVARNEVKLIAAANTIRINYSVNVVTIAQDLSKSESTQAIMKELQDKGIHVSLLVNNAGFGWLGLFHNTPPEKIQGMINTMCLSVTDLTSCLLPKMLERNEGGIIFMSSLAGFFPSPGFAVYGATKAYLKQLAINLYTEYADHGIDILAVCPGVVNTPFAKRAQHEVYVSQIQPEEVVKKSLASLGKKVVLIIPHDMITRMASLLSGVTPLNVMIKISKMVVKQMFGLNL